MSETLSMSSKNPVVILYPSKTLQSHMDTIVPATRLIIASSHSPDPAKRFDLGDEFTPIVEEAKRLYQKIKSLSEPPEVSSHGAVFQQSPYVGRLHDTVVVPIENDNDYKISVRDKDGNAAETSGKIKRSLRSLFIFRDMVKNEKDEIMDNLSGVYW